jgi:hypothetical protein
MRCVTEPSVFFCLCVFADDSLFRLWVGMRNFVPLNGINIYFYATKEIA